MSRLKRLRWWFRRRRELLAQIAYLEGKVMQLELEHAKLQRFRHGETVGATKPRRRLGEMRLDG